VAVEIPALNYMWVNFKQYMRGSPDSPYLVREDRKKSPESGKKHSEQQFPHGVISKPEIGPDRRIRSSLED
jgi:hypothetical protein